jgi:glutaryl-CoA dehydrogenase
MSQLKRANWKDIFGGVGRYLRANPESAAMLEVVDKFCEQELRPRLASDYGDASPEKMRGLMKEIGALGVFGPTVSTANGGLGLDKTAYGLFCRSIESVDSGYRSAFSVQSSLTMHPIEQFGTDSQRKKYLPELQSGRMIGCFGLTEPNAGSDPGGMTSIAVKDGEDWVLNSQKTWITASPISDIALVWAKCSNDGLLRGFLVERGSPGFETPVIDGKESLKASITGSIFLEDVRVPNSNVLNVTGYRGPFTCLNSARLGIAFGTLGAAERCIEVALDYTESRHQFGAPLASKQLVQQKLADCVISYNTSLASCLMSTSDGQPNTTAISILKKNSVKNSLDIARETRALLGGNGIVADYEIFRHMSNLETCITYEGTDIVHSLIIGRDITGHSAF